MSSDELNLPNDVIVDRELFIDFCTHLSAGINALDLVYVARALNSPEFSAGRDDPVLLAALDQQNLSRLTALNYSPFICACARRLRLLPNCQDIFLSELGRETFDLFEKAFTHVMPRTTVETTDRGFVVHLPSLISDAVLPVLGRVHCEVLHSLDQFSRMLAAVGDDPTRLFLNAKSPTPESQYIQLWVATQLKIPVQLSTGVIAVV